MSNLMRITIVVVLGLTAAAHAQPVPAPYAYQPPMNDEERELLGRGEISQAKSTGGGVAAMFFGLGVGQAIQGRWLERGWIFTLGDLGATGLIVAGTLTAFGRNCDDSCNTRAGALFVAGALVGGGLRVWQSVDAFTGPAKHNRRVRELRTRLGMPSPNAVTVMPYVTPLAGGAAGGFALQF